MKKNNILLLALLIFCLSYITNTKELKAIDIKNEKSIMIATDGDGGFLFAEIPNIKTNIIKKTDNVSYISSDEGRTWRLLKKMKYNAKIMKKNKKKFISYDDGVSWTEIIDKSNEFQVSPNPADEFIKIELTEKKSQDIAEVNMFDLNGNKVINFTTTNNTVKVRTNKLTAGNYFVTIEYNNRILRKSVIIE